MYRQATGRARKRRQDAPAPTGDGSGPLLLEGPTPLPPSDDNVVEKAKVVQHLNKLTPQDDANPSACIKIVLSNVEAAMLTQEVQDAMVADFGISSVSASDANHLSVDRIVTIYGDLVECLRCALHIAFLMNAEVNNVSKTEHFTLKSQNYHLDVLVEISDLEMERLAKRFPQNSMDAGPFDTNRGLQFVTLSGDFASLFNSLVYIFYRHHYDKYAADSAINIIPVISVYQDADKEDPELEKSKQRILNFVYNKPFLNQ